MKNINSISLVLLLIISSCSSPLEQTCTAVFLSSSVTVLTPSGELADSVDIRITIGNDDESFDPCTEVLGERCDQEGADGTYVIFHDGFMDQIDEGENATVVVEGTRGELSFTQEFVFTNDGCHIAKVAGPDTVTLQAN